VWTSDGATKRVPTGTATDTPPLMIESVNGKTITFNQGITGLTAGDRVARMDLDAYGPATLLTGQSGWPTPPASQTAYGGLGGDSYRHGLMYAHNADTSTYYLGKLKSAVPELVVNRVTSDAPVPLTWAHGWVLKDRVTQVRNADVVKGWIGLMSFAQRRRVWDLGTAINTRVISGDKPGKSYDATPSNNNYGDTFDFGDTTCYVDKRLVRNRVHFFDPARNWGRAVLFDTRPYKDLEGRAVFQKIDTNGNRLTIHEFGFESSYDWACRDPKAEGYIDMLSVDDNT
jgi:hypothetical protein